MPTLPPVVRQVASGAALMLPGILSILVVAMLVLLASVLLAKRNALKSTEPKEPAGQSTAFKASGGRNTGKREPSKVQTRTEKVSFSERQHAAKQRTDKQNLEAAVKAFHGAGGPGKSVRSAAKDVDRRTLSCSLKRTIQLYNQEEELKRDPELIVDADDIVALRNIPISRVLRLTFLPKMGRGDSLTTEEIGMIHVRTQNCLSLRACKSLYFAGEL
jgi:hypothetical protein